MKQARRLNQFQAHASSGNPHLSSVGPDVSRFQAVWARALIVCLSLGIAAAATTPVSAANEFDGFLEYVKLWTKAAPPPPSEFSAEQQAEWQTDWKQISQAARQLRTAWENELHQDPSLRRALQAYDRSLELEQRYQQLRQQLRKQYGRQQFQQLESRGATWLRKTSADWLDLNDQALMRLTIRVLRLDDYRILRTGKPFSEQITTAPLTELRALEIYRAGMRQLQITAAAQDRTTDLPPLMQEYLQLREEADYLFFVGETYLCMTPRPEVERAKQEFTQSITRAATWFPELHNTLIRHAETHGSTDRKPQPLPLEARKPQAN
jgi:hypothetical protein